jgi:tetratricopeptide (TPR) repeat protein
MAGTLTANEEAQLLQTIEMFEVITQSQPLDYQSLEILKEAYSKLGREKDVVGTAKRIAEAYVHLGQLSSAILEYESILQRFPDDPDVQAALAEIENKANSFSAPAAPGESDFLEKSSASNAFKNAVNGIAPAAEAEIDDGKQQMQKVFTDSKLINAGDFDLHWPLPQNHGRHPAESFLQNLADHKLIELEQGLRLLCEKARTAFLPIDKYDVDVDFARTFPRELCMRWSVLPFDRMSKSVLVATTNPFNKQAARELESHTKSRLVWYVAPPVELTKTLKRIFR